MNHAQKTWGILFQGNSRNSPRGLFKGSLDMQTGNLDQDVKECEWESLFSSAIFTN